MSNITKLEQQMQLEEEALNMGIKRYQEARLPWQGEDKKRSQESDLPPGMVQLARVIQPVSAAISEWVDKALGRGDSHRIGKGAAIKHASLARIIENMDTDVVAFLVSKRIINALGRNPETVQKVAAEISQWIIDEKNYETFKASAPAYHYVIEKSNKKSSSQRHRMAVMRNAMDKAGVAKEEIDTATRVKLGSAMLDKFMAATGMVEIVARRRGKKTVNILQGTPAILEWMEKAHARCELLAPFHLPMVCKPMDWSSPVNGGYLNKRILPLRLVKTHDRNYLEELSHWDMPEVYATVNALQNTPWQINRKVFEVMLEAWDAGRAIGGLPVRDELPLPTKPLDIADNEEARNKWKVEARQIHEANAKLKSKRIAMSQKMWIAQKFVEEEAIYFPCVLDWRSRFYYVPTLVNPQADDTGKALLHFSEGKPLGESGGFWLAVHIANLFGVDKVSLEERVQWTQEHSTEICMSALQPLDFQFWCEADKPWQALAACIEWEGFMREGNDFVSHIPIAMDGSNNGLQHFAMMLRDVESGKAVNLIPSEKPEDIYTRVADIVSKKVEKDAAKGEEMAALWLGKVTRKICKRPCMTLPYGATQYGMKDQIKQELNKQAAEGNVIIDAENLGTASAYLGKVIYESLSEVVSAATQAMDWLQEAARVVAKDGLPVRWVTPSGFPVVQSYRKSALKRVQTSIGGTVVNMRIAEKGDKLDKRRQAAGISPNVVHSLDASHLVKTVNMCEEYGLKSFAMVHDSYGVHACDTDDLNNFIRQAFVMMYSGDVLADFRDQLVNSLPEELAEKLPALPTKGDLEPAAVLDSEYFFA